MGVARCVRACLCVCVFIRLFVFVRRMYHGCFASSIFEMECEMENKERSDCHVELYQCELQMQVRQL